MLPGEGDVFLVDRAITKRVSKVRSYIASFYAYSYTCYHIMSVSIQNGHSKYLIAWSGFPLEDSTWVPSAKVNEHVKRLL